MVMEAPPSPQCVGREFVRQYYTLLNQAPTHLHRFYNNQSSFVHGGLDAPNRDTSPMIGQKQIHQKIQQLNFQDCHAKITQVDSQATLGNGVVVQVTGELSNAGQPMRRFTQTFVLASQSPKKYYVHNDIFRYQDEIFTDEECDQESGRSEAEDDMGPEQTVQEIPQPNIQQHMAYYAAPNAVPGQMQTPPPSIPIATHPSQMAAVITPAPVATVNGAVHPEDVILQASPAMVPQAQIPPVAATIQGIPVHAPTVVPVAAVIPRVDDVAIPPVQIAPELPEEIPTENNLEEKIPEPDIVEEPAIVEPVVPVSNEPKTYATLVKSGGGAGPVSFAAAMSTSPNQPTKPVSSPPPSSANRAEVREQTPQGTNINSSNSAPMGQRTGPPPRNNRGPPGSVRGPVRQEPRGPGRISYNDDNDDRRRSSGGPGSQYGDSHQLFLGNLPLHATEDDLREVFNTFGPIADLRIHSKPAAKMPGARVPNYGFITFEDLQSVQNCLLARPLYFPSNSENGQKLNVEEKKTRPRPSMEGGRIGGGQGGPQDSGPGMGGGRPGNGPGPRPGAGGPGMMRSGGPPRGGRGGFNRSDGGRSGGPVNRGGNNFNRR